MSQTYREVRCPAPSRQERRGGEERVVLFIAAFLIRRENILIAIFKNVRIFHIREPKREDNFL